MRLWSRKRRLAASIVAAAALVAALAVAGPPAAQAADSDAIPPWAKSAETGTAAKPQAERRVVSMSLADAVLLLLRNNRSIRSAYLNRITAKYALILAEDRFVPTGTRPNFHNDVAIITCIFRDQQATHLIV